MNKWSNTVLKGFTRLNISNLKSHFFFLIRNVYEITGREVTDVIKRRFFVDCVEFYVIGASVAVLHLPTCCHTTSDTGECTPFLSGYEKYIKTTNKDYV